MNQSSQQTRINYVEFPVRDIEKSKSFYGTAFNWTFTDYGPNYCEFNDGQMKGGFELSEEVHPGQPLVVLYSDDLERTQTNITNAGGTIVREIFDFPGGCRFHFTDPDGYELAVWTEA